MCAAANYLPAGQDKTNRSARTEFGDILRARTGAVRFVKSHHDLKRKTVHLRLTQSEQQI
jgi:hypothetical protein